VSRESSVAFVEVVRSNLLLWQAGLLMDREKNAKPAVIAKDLVFTTPTPPMDRLPVCDGWMTGE